MIIEFSKEKNRKLTSIGDLKLLQNKLFSIFCSVKCPGELILKTYEYFKLFKKTETSVISGFQSPVEKESLRLLLRNKQPTIICYARDISRLRVPKKLNKSIDEGYLLLISPFNKSPARTTIESARQRNEYIASIATTIFVPYADPNGKLIQLCKKLSNSNKHLSTFNSEYNRILFESRFVKLITP